MTKRVMIVDDAALMRVTIQNLLKEDPALEVVGWAANGKQALEKLADARPDLIMLDIEMPEMDGLEFLRHARLKCRAKIIVLSSVTAAGSHKASQARSLGADAVVSKPSGAVSFDLKEKRGSELISTIHQVLGI